MEREDKRGVFFGVIGVLTLIVAIIGASLAYFSINANSEQNAVTVEAANLRVVYTKGDELRAEDIIPSTRAIALTTLTRALDESVNTENQYETCKDDDGHTVCSYYDFTVTNSGKNDITVDISLIPEALATDGSEVPFKNLKFILFERTAATDPQDNGTELATIAGETSYSQFFLEQGVGLTSSTNGEGSSKSFRLVAWLDEVAPVDGINYQNQEQGAKFQATIYVATTGSGSGIVTGRVDGATE